MPRNGNGSRGWTVVQWLLEAVSQGILSMLLARYALPTGNTVR
jgi:hypothetical protein